MPGISKHIVLFICLIPGILACNKKSGTTENTVIPPVTEYPLRPAHFPPAVYQHTSNPYSTKGYELGKRLFFDPILSANNTISCGSCHKPASAFADGGVALSKGVDGKTGKRHSPAIFNMAWNKSFMWDGGVNHIEIMPFAPIINPVEMAQDMRELIHELNTHPAYPAMFRTVFGKDSIDDQQLFYALAQYMSNLVSADAKYDEMKRRETTFSAEEMEGYRLFQTHCNACHTEPLFTDNSYRNNGLDKTFSDSGRYRISQRAEDMGTFKVPTLRNVTLTPPYMHDGRIKTLTDVVEHYATGVQPSATLSPLLMKNGNPGLQLNDTEKQRIMQFLYTLTDSSFVAQHAH
jgi:cytochrome c peroxidase